MKSCSGFIITSAFNCICLCEILPVVNASYPTQPLNILPVFEFEAMFAGSIEPSFHDLQ